jgi:tetratricopeptide (TPR) repeat protein
MAGDDLPSEVFRLVEKGNRHMRSGRPGSAATVYRQAVSVAAELIGPLVDATEGKGPFTGIPPDLLKYNVEIATTPLLHLGKALSLQGSFDEARDYYLLTMKILDHYAPLAEKTVICLNLMGEAFQALGASDVALECFEEARRRSAAGNA